MTFIIEQDEKVEWICNRLPPFIDLFLVTWIGKTIEDYKKNIEETIWIFDARVYLKAVI